MGYMLKDFEMTFEMPKRINNLINVTDGGKDFVYEGSFYDLKFDGFSTLKCTVNIEKKYSTEQKESRISKAIKDFKKEFFTSDEEKNYIWSYSLYAIEIVKKGELNKNYRNSLIEQSSSNGVLISDNLLNVLFNIMDERALFIYSEIYSKAKAFRS